jgi:hypothetical protein
MLVPWEAGSSYHSRSELPSAAFAWIGAAEAGRSATVMTAAIKPAVIFLKSFILFPPFYFASGLTPKGRHTVQSTSSAFVQHDVYIKQNLRLAHCAHPISYIVQYNDERQFLQYNFNTSTQ